MKNPEQYKRLIRFIYSMVLLSLEIGFYGYIWLNYYNKMMDTPYNRTGNWLMIAVYGILLFVFNMVYGGFKIGYFQTANIIYSQMLSSVCANIMIYLQITLLTKHFQLLMPLVAVTGIEFIIILLWSFSFNRIYRVLYPPRRVVLIYGDRPVKSLMGKLNTRMDRFIIGDLAHISLGLETLREKIELYDGVIICDVPSQLRNMILKYCYGKSIRVYITPKISDILIKSSESLHLFDTPLLLSRNTGLSFEQRIIKRAMDIVLSVLTLIVLSPVFLITAFFIKLNDGGPVLFHQARCTKDGRIFNIYKFRSMVVDAEKEGKSIPATNHDSRITPIGNFIRKLRIDELPQLFNILKGDMSIVGPRPERIEHVEKYTKEIPEFEYRLKVKGGLTGYAQVHGKYNTSAYDKLKLDLMYIQNYSLLLDLEIIFKTIKILFLRESTEGFADMNSAVNATKDSFVAVDSNKVERHP